MTADGRALQQDTAVSSQHKGSGFKSCPRVTLRGICVFLPVPARHCCLLQQFKFTPLGVSMEYGRRPVEWHLERPPPPPPVILIRNKWQLKEIVKMQETAIMIFPALHGPFRNLQCQCCPPWRQGRPLLPRPLNFTESLDGNICAKVCFPPTTLTSLFYSWRCWTSTQMMTTFGFTKNLCFKVSICFSIR